MDENTSRGVAATVADAANGIPSPEEYDEDPNQLNYEVYNEVEFQNIVDFYKNNIEKDPLVITIVTDRSKINIDKILDYGELIELDKEKVFN